MLGGSVPQGAASWKETQVGCAVTESAPWNLKQASRLDWGCELSLEGMLTSVELELWGRKGSRGERDAWRQSKQEESLEMEYRLSR